MTILLLTVQILPPLAPSGPPTDFHIVVLNSTTVEVQWEDPFPKPCYLFALVAGDLVSVPARKAHAYTLCALDDCELIFFPSDEFFKLARHEAGMIDEALERTMLALSRSREKAISLGRKSAQERLASFLITMAERIGKNEADACVMELPMSRRDIADSLGLTIETVSRQLSELRDAGLIETSGRSQMRLLDTDRLNARAGHLVPAE